MLSPPVVDDLLLCLDSLVVVSARLSVAFESAFRRRSVSLCLEAFVSVLDEDLESVSAFDEDFDPVVVVSRLDSVVESTREESVDTVYFVFLELEVPFVAESDILFFFGSD